MTLRAGVVALALLVAGCASGSSTSSGPDDVGTPVGASSAPVVGSPTFTGTPTPTGSSAATPAHQPSPRSTAAASAVPAAGSKDFGYFPAVQSARAPVRLSFDRALFLTGAEADKAAAAHGDETPVPNDYYIVNDNKALRTLTLADSVKVFGSSGLNNYAGESDVQARPRTVSELLGFVATVEGRQTGFNLVYGEGGLVVRVEEQYQP